MSERTWEEVYRESVDIKYENFIGGKLTVAALHGVTDSIIELILAIDEDTYQVPFGWAHKDVLYKWEFLADKPTLTRKAINLFDETKRLIAKNGWPEHGLDTLF